MPRTKKTTIHSNPLSEVSTKKSSAAKSTPKKHAPKSGSALVIEDVEFKESHKKPAEVMKDDRRQLAMKTVKKWANWSTASGLVPIPLADLAVVSGIHIKLISSLCKIYEVPFRKEAAKAVLNGLIGGGAVAYSSKYLAKLFVKNIPVVGFAVHFVAQQAISYATTYSLGVVFIRHFEKNGSLSNLNLDQAKKDFQIEIQAIETKAS